MLSPTASSHTHTRMCIQLFMFIIHVKHAPQVVLFSRNLIGACDVDSGSSYASITHAPSFGASCLKHAPSFGDSDSSYILDTARHLAIPVRLFSFFRPPHLAIPVHQYVHRFRLISSQRFRFIMYVGHAPSSHHISENTRPLLAIPVHHTYIYIYTYMYIYLCISNTPPPFGDSGSSCILSTPPHL